MKTPKVDAPKPKFKFNTPKNGLVRKSLGQISNKSLKKLSSKGSEQVLSFLREDEGSVELKSKAHKKLRMSLPAHALNNTSPVGFVNGKTPRKSLKSPAKKSVTPEIPQSGKKKYIVNLTSKKTDSPVPEVKQLKIKRTPQNRNKLNDIKTPSSVENNTSPVKQNLDSKKAKVPFNLDESLTNQTLDGLKRKKDMTPEKSTPNSPEVQLGLQLEEALSPKSRGKKKKKLISGKVATVGKVVVSKKVVNEEADSSTKDSKEGNTESKSQKRRRIKKYKNSMAKVGLKPSIFKLSNALNAVSAVLNVLEPKKVDLLDSDQYIYLQFNLLKQSELSRGVFKIQLPHCILPDSPEVCLITPDLKGKRNDPEEAIDHYKEMLKQNDITAITEIIPLRKLKQEYSQFEERRKLANRVDCIISDGRICQIAKLGKRFARFKKCTVSIKFSTKNLKEDINKALSKVCIFSSGKGTSLSIKCGRIGMSSEEIANNIVVIGEFFANNEALIGEPQNFSSIFVKTALSDAFPLFISTVTPNEVKTPKGKEKKVERPVKGEVTTVEDATVVVYPSGHVRVKKRKNVENDGIENKLKSKPQKKAKMDAIKKKEEGSYSDESIENEESDDDWENNELLSSSDEANSDSEESVNSIEAEDVSEDDSVDDDDDDDNGEEDDDDNSLKEEEIEAAEKEYLKELRILQDEIDKQEGKTLGVKSKDGNKKGQQKQNNSQGKKAEVKETAKDKKGKQSNVRRNENQFQKNMKGRSPQELRQRKGKNIGQGEGPNRSVSNFQKRSPGQGRKQKFKNKKGLAGKNKN